MKTLFFIGLSLLSIAIHAQQLNILEFESSREWNAARWYLVGRWTSGNEIRWLDGKSTRVQWDDRACQRSPFIPRFESRSSTDGPLEILRSGPLIAIEINPIIIRENFKLMVRKPKSVEYCHATLELGASLSGQKDKPKPLLMLQPKGSQYFGKTINFAIVNLTEVSNLQLDVQMGYWYFKLPNAQAIGAATKLHMFPVAVAHLEWLLSESANWGAQAFLEQSVAEWGAKTDQHLIVSNWGSGLFYQHFLRVSQGLQLRYFLEYSQFRADDGEKIRSMASKNLEAHYLNFGLMAHLYFGDRWSSGIEGKYGPSNNMAGRGGAQGNYQGYLKFNYRASPSITVLSTFGARILSAEGANNESIYSSVLGFSLDL